MEPKAAVETETTPTTPVAVAEAVAQRISPPSPAPITAAAPVQPISPPAAAVAIPTAAAQPPAAPPSPVMSPQIPAPPASPPTAPAAASADPGAGGRGARPAAVESGAALARGLEALSEVFAAYARHGIDTATRGAIGLLGVRTWSDAVEVNTGLARASFVKWLESSAKVSELGVRLAVESSQPFLSSFARVSPAPDPRR